MRLVIVSVVVGLFLMAESPALAQGNGKKPAAPEEKIYAFEMHAKPWASVFEWLSDKTGRPFISSTIPSGTFNFVNQNGKKYTIPQIIDIINEGLLHHKQLLLNRDTSFTLVPADEKIGPALVPRVYPADLEKHGLTEIVTMLYQCHSLLAADIAPDVKKQMGPFGEIVALHNANQLILQDTVANLMRIKKELDGKESASSTLENLLNKAVKNNPDIRVAESKVREAEAVLNLVRMQVAQKITAAHAAVRGAQALVKEAALKLETAQQQRMRNGTGTVEDLRPGQLTIDKMMFDLAAKEADLQYLLGHAPGRDPGSAIESRFVDVYSMRDAKKLGYSAPGPNKSKTGMSNKQEAELLRALEEQLLDAAKHLQVQLPVSTSTADKIRKALDIMTPPNLFFDQAPPKDVLDYLQQHAKGINIIEQVRLDKVSPVTVRLKEPVPLGAIFQFLEDTYGWRFVIREYGIVLAEANHLPPGAVHLQDFWRSQQGPEAMMVPGPGGTGKAERK